MFTARLPNTRLRNSVARDCTSSAMAAEAAVWPRVEMLDPTFGISRPGPTSNKILREKLAIGTDRNCQRVDATELLARWACALAITPRDKRRLRTNHFKVSATAITKGRMQILGGISARSDEGYWWPRTT